MSITIQEIESAQKASEDAHKKVAEMIAAFKSQAEFAGRFPITVPAPLLLPGELFVCSIIEPNGKKYHLTLLPGDNNGTDHDAQLAWAAKNGGDLPDLTEQALLRKYLPDEFQKCAYWSNEKHKTERGWAWCAGFNYGNQYYNNTYSKFRGRAVRRLVFE